MSADEWMRTERLGRALPRDLSLGPFEGVELPVFRGTSKNGRLHGDSECSASPQGVLRAETVPLTSEVVGRLCSNCLWALPAAHPLWDLVELATLVTVGLQGLELDSDGAAEYVAEVQEEVAGLASSREVAVEDDDDEAFESRRRVDDVRDGLRERWRRLTSSLVRTRRLVDSAPWLTEWAREYLRVAEQSAECYRVSLAGLVGSRLAIEGATAAKMTRPEPTDGDHDHLEPELIDRLWWEWQHAPTRSWRSLREQTWLSTYEVSNHFGRRRKGRPEAEHAAARLWTQWSTAATNATMDIHDHVLVDLRLSPREDRPSWRRDRRDDLDPWSVAAIVTYQESVDWASGTIRLRCPRQVADVLADRPAFYTWPPPDADTERYELGPSSASQVLWGPAVPAEGTGFGSFSGLAHWPDPSGPEPPRHSLAWGRWFAARHGDIRLPRAVAALDSTADLRTVQWPEWMTPHDRSTALDALLVGARFASLDALVDGAPLGPLADVQVYSTNAQGQYMEKSHAVDCEHFKTLEPDHDLHTVEDFVEILRESYSRDRWSSRWCSKCGGYSVRRLNQEEYDYFLGLRDR